MLSLLTFWNVSERQLKLGCRCVEIDVWNGPEGNHCQQLCIPKKLIKASRKWPTEWLAADGCLCETSYKKQSSRTRSVFLPIRFSPASSIEHLVNRVFQVILSIENHLSTEQQDTMAVMMKDIFGSLLYTEEVSWTLQHKPYNCSFATGGCQQRMSSLSRRPQVQNSHQGKEVKEDRNGGEKEWRFE